MSFLAVKRAWAVLADDERQAFMDFLHSRKGLKPFADKKQNLVDLAAALKGLDEVVVKDGQEQAEKAALEAKNRQEQEIRLRRTIDAGLTKRELEVSAKEGELAEKARNLKEREEAVERREGVVAPK